MNQITFTPPLTPTPMAQGLVRAAAATMILAAAGVDVLHVFCNGRQPTLMVSQLPEGAVGVTKRSHPNGMGGRTVVTAAPFHGCQLEWMHDVYGPRSAGEGVMHA